MHRQLLSIIAELYRIANIELDYGGTHTLPIESGSTDKITDFFFLQRIFYFHVVPTGITRNHDL